MSKKINNKYNMSPHQIDRALQLRLEQGLPGGDMLVLSTAYMRRRVHQCLRDKSPEPILRYHGWKPGDTSFNAEHMWGEEAKLLTEYGLKVEVLSGHIWEKLIPLSNLPPDQQDMYKDIVTQ